jgi:hypothetical protein
MHTRIVDVLAEILRGFCSLETGGEKQAAHREAQEKRRDRKPARDRPVAENNA